MKVREKFEAIQNKDMLESFKTDKDWFFKRLIRLLNFNISDAAGE